jgi:hypothetical protein
MQKSSAVPYIPASTSTIQKRLPLRACKSDSELWKFYPALSFYPKAETACYALLAISGIGAIIYSASVFLR